MDLHLQNMFFMPIKHYFCFKIIIMFSTNQLYFAVFFIISFTIAMIYVYRKDLSLHKLHYKGSSKWVLIGFLSFVLILFVLKFYLKNN